MDAGGIILVIITANIIARNAATIEALLPRCMRLLICSYNNLTCFHLQRL